MPKRGNTELMPPPAPIPQAAFFYSPNPAEHGSNRAQAREKFNRSYLCLRDCLGTMVTDTSLKACGGKKTLNSKTCKKKRKREGFLMELLSTHRNTK